MKPAERRNWRPDSSGGGLTRPQFCNSGGTGDLQRFFLGGMIFGMPSGILWVVFFPHWRTHVWPDGKP